MNDLSKFDAWEARRGGFLWCKSALLLIRAALNQSDSDETLYVEATVLHCNIAIAGSSETN